MARFQRKKYMINQRFQLLFCFENMVFMFFVAVIIGWSIYIGLLRAIIFDLGGEKLTLINHYISFRMVTWFLPTVFAILVFSVFISHKIAGPMFVFQRAIKKMINNEPVEPIHLRRNDKLKDFAEDLNMLIVRYNENKKNPGYGERNPGENLQ